MAGVGERKGECLAVCTLTHGSALSPIAPPCSKCRNPQKWYGVKLVDGPGDLGNESMFDVFPEDARSRTYLPNSDVAIRIEHVMMNGERPQVKLIVTENDPLPRACRNRQSPR